MKVKNIILCMLLSMCALTTVACSNNNTPEEPGIPTKTDICRHVIDEETCICNLCNKFVQPAFTNGLTFEYYRDEWRVKSYKGDDTNVIIPSWYHGLEGGDKYQTAKVTSVHSNAFANNSKITSVEISNNITTLAGHAFYACSNLSEVKLPSTLTKIDTGALALCPNLKEIVIPQATKVSYDAFIQSGIEKIFYMGSEIEWNTNTPSLISSGHKYFYSEEEPTNTDKDNYWTYDSNGNPVVWSEYSPAYTSGLEFELNKEGTSYTVTKYTGRDATVRVPNKYLGLPVTVIGGQSFSDNDKLETVILPENITTIGEAAFAHSSLSNITLGDNITNYGSSIFINTNLTEVPQNIKQITYLMFAFCPNLVNATIPEGITKIEKNSFWGCENLKNLTLSSTVTYIGADAFRQCTVLENIKWSESHALERIGDSAFKLCPSLTNLVLPEGLKRIDKYAFEGCVNLATITFPASLELIDEEAFRSDVGLSNVTFTEVKGWKSYYYRGDGTINIMNIEDALLVPSEAIHKLLVVNQYLKRTVE